ncbi:MAG: SGNH/GDSL hydrolase family protein [Verrucomicrobiales bacterium]|jgi:lysophospholipase L1-like esterase|nr:SGNH/GDSL hydrolase family protein [Verrucomicrobiales bacterium]
MIKRSMIGWCKTLALTFCFTGSLLAAEQHASLPADVHRVIFLGDSITFAGQYIVYVDDYFSTRQPEAKIEFINVGVSSETTSGLSEPGHAGGAFPRPDLHERLARVLDQIKPDLAFVCYGVNDGIYQPFDEGRFQKFKDGMTWTHEQLAKRNIKVIHLTPATYDGWKTKNLAYNDVIAKYCEWLLAQRQAANWQVIDMNGPMTAYLLEKRKAEPDFFYANDGVHPNDFGHWLMAKQILIGLGAKDVEQFATGEEMAKAVPNGDKIFQLVKQRQNNLRDTWLRETKHLRPGLPGYLYEKDDAEKKAQDTGRQIEQLLQGNKS